MGTSMRELIEVHAGGMLPGYELRAVSPGGASTAFVAAADIDVAIDFERHGDGRHAAWAPARPSLLDDQTCPVGMTLNMQQFFAQESCGWCTPCREGLQWTVTLLARHRGGPRHASRTSTCSPSRSGSWARTRRFCDLAPGAMQPLEAALGSSATTSSGTSRRAAARTARGRRAVASAAGDGAAARVGAGERHERRTAPELVTVVIDGREFRVEAGRNMLDVALSLGFDLPFFCWHPLMGSIGACRQCAVRLCWTGRDGEEKSEIAMACMTEAQEGTRIVIDDEEATRVPRAA